MVLAVSWILIGAASHLPAAAAQIRAEEATSQLHADWASGTDRAIPVHNQAWATVSISAIGLADEIVLEGTDPEQINVGIGHYEGTAFPWDNSGNVALAGHRTGWGEPFADLDQLQPGDTITIQTGDATYTYTLTGSTVVDPSETWVLGDVPPEVTGTTGDTQLLTLTTCEGAQNEERLIIWAELTTVRPGP